MYRPNHPSTINSGAESVQFNYEQNHARYSAVYSGASGLETTYFIGQLLEKVVTAGNIDYRHYIYAGPSKVGIYSRTSAGTNTMRYVREDHLGGVASLLNGDGTSYVKESFTAFGNRRSACTWSGAPTTGQLSRINAASRRGFSWHTALGAMGLNDMIGRIEDALIGRFLSADPSPPAHTDTQSWNRYSYARNNPLTFVDPSGFADDQPVADTDGGYAREIINLGMEGGNGGLDNTPSVTVPSPAADSGGGYNVALTAAGFSFGGGSPGRTVTAPGTFGGAAQTQASQQSQEQPTDTVTVTGGAAMQADDSIATVIVTGHAGGGSQVQGHRGRLQQGHPSKATCQALAVAAGALSGAAGGAATGGSLGGGAGAFGGAVVGAFLGAAGALIPEGGFGGGVLGAAITLIAHAAAGTNAGGFVQVATDTAQGAIGDNPAANIGAGAAGGALSEAYFAAGEAEIGAAAAEGGVAGAAGAATAAITSRGLSYLLHAAGCP